MVDRDGPQQQAVDGREDGRVRADAERERQDDDGGPAFAPQQQPDGVAEIVNHEAIADNFRSRISDCGLTFFITCRFPILHYCRVRVGGQY